MSVFMPGKHKPASQKIKSIYSGITNFSNNQDGLLHNQRADNQLEQTIQKTESKAVWGLGYGHTYETSKIVERKNKNGKTIKLRIENPFEFSMRRLKDDKTIALYPHSIKEEVLDLEEIDRMGGTSQILSRCKTYTKE